MTRHVGSRASCYPPDSVSFRRSAGARADCGLPRAYVVKRARGGLALRLAGARLGKYPESGGCADREQQIPTGISRYGGKAAPTRATLHQSRSEKRSFSAAKKPLDRGRSSETILQLFFAISCFDDFQIRDFSDFDRATIAKRSRPPGVGAGRPWVLTENPSRFTTPWPGLRRRDGVIFHA